LGLIQEMVIGDSATVYVPIDSLKTPPEKFLHSENLEYRVKVLNIENQEVYMDRIGAAQKKIREDAFTEAKTAFDDYKAGKYKNNLIEKDHNVKVAIVNPSKGDLPNYEDAVSVNYYGFFDDGKSFDSSYKVGKPYTFVLGRGSVIQGWDIGIPSVAKGATAIIDIPYPMAYGKAGSSAIPPRSNLFFWVKVEDIQKPTIKK
jgi:FKBP-type peptidyl-prolyl cis-trans isomerase